VGVAKKDLRRRCATFYDPLPNPPPQGGREQSERAARPVTTPTTSYLWGPLSRFGFIVAAVTLAFDQALKLWLLFGLRLIPHERVSVVPFVDLYLTWNKGISYGLFQQDGDLGRWVLIAIKLGAVALLTVWLARADSRLTALSLGLIIGGALGNAIDRLAYGAVADFILFHIMGAGWSFNWYVFNLADAAIVAGVIGLLYDSLIQDRAAKAP
jgi:signal peptidase II